MIKIAFVDDQKKEQDIFKNYTEQFLKENNQYEFDIHTFKDGNEFPLNDLTYNIVFLDILMPNKDGMTLAHEIREVNKNIIIIFITNMGQYAINGYEVEALDFILKPVSYPSFKMKLQRALRVYDQQSNNNKVIEIAKKLISVNNIIYIEVISHNLYFHNINNEEIVCRGSLKEFEEKLSNGFSRCHSGFLVNLKYVSSIEGNTVHLQNGQKLSLARNKKKDFINDFTKFLGENN